MCTGQERGHVQEGQIDELQKRSGNGLVWAVIPLDSYLVLHKLDNGNASCGRGAHTSISHLHSFAQRLLAVVQQYRRFKKQHCVEAYRINRCTGSVA